MITLDATNFLNKLLNLPFKGHEQDWAVEMGNPYRIKEFIEVYKTKDLTNDQQYALVSLIIASYDDLLNNKIDGVDLWKDIRQILLPNKILFKGILDYWALGDETEKEYCFEITPLIRDIINK